MLADNAGGLMVDSTEPGDLPSGCSYISGRYSGNPPETLGSQPELLRAASRNLDQTKHVEFRGEGDRVVLHETLGGRERIEAIFVEDSRQVRRLIIQRFYTTSGKPTKQSFSFNAAEAQVVIALLQQVGDSSLPEGSGQWVDDSTIDAVLGDAELLRRLYDRGGRDQLSALVQADVGASDVLAIAHRKEELARFERMLADEEYFSEATASAKGPERAWQGFFEENQWIFGYGLTHIFLEGWDASRLEQITTGSSAMGAGKRVDALLATSGFIRSLCFVEIKVHTTELLQHNSNRPGVWAPSRDLVEAVAQLQRTVDEATHSIGKHLESRSEDGNLTGTRAHLVQPRSFLVIGSLEQLTAGQQGTENPDKFRSFELLRRNTASPEIVTFDELLARARFIVDGGGSPSKA